MSKLWPFKKGEKGKNRDESKERGKQKVPKDKNIKKKGEKEDDNWLWEEEEGDGRPSGSSDRERKDEEPTEESTKELQEAGERVWGAPENQAMKSSDVRNIEAMKEASKQKSEMGNRSIIRNPNNFMKKSILSKSTLR